MTHAYGYACTRGDIAKLIKHQIDEEYLSMIASGDTEYFSYYRGAIAALNNLLLTLVNEIYYPEDRK